MTSRSIRLDRRKSLHRMGGYGLSAMVSPFLPACGSVDERDSVAEGDGSTAVISAGGVARSEAKGYGPYTGNCSPSNENIRNPERGLIGWGDDPMAAGSHWWMEHTLLPQRIAEGCTLVRAHVLLSNYVDVDSISSTDLSALSAGMDVYRQMGLKVVLRFMYSSPGVNAPYTNQPEAPLTRVRKHIEQLGPTVTANKDIICAIDAGFIGPWGEWHSSTNGLDAPYPRTRIKEDLLLHFPADRKILFRNPRHIHAWYGETITGATGGPPETRRIGMHNDSILTLGWNNGGTWLTSDFDAPDGQDLRQYIARLVERNPYAGELAAGGTYVTNVDQVVHDFYRNRPSWLSNYGGHDELKSKLDSWAPWAYDEMIRRLGYRIYITTHTQDSWTFRGDTFVLSLGIRNDGYARITNGRSVYLRCVPRFSGAPVRDLLIPDLNPWDWYPTYIGPDIDTGSRTVIIPADMAPGEYDLGIRIPDPSPSLQNDARYCLRFANSDVPASASNDFQGWNNDTGTFMLASRLSVV